MFTGIIEEVGRVRSVEDLETGRRLAIDAGAAREDMHLGDSIALDGVCTTVVGVYPGGFTIEAIGTTLSRTTLGAFAPGRRINLEQPMRLGDRLGGHLVQGHVDAVGQVTGIRREGEHVLLDVRMPEEVAEITVLHGSIAINGVSLTVNQLLPEDVAQVALIPYTWEHTNLSDLSIGDGVNLEADMLGKFVAQLAKRHGSVGVPSVENR
ncbi:MAG TPA: riboflavin synthase [Longimicrobiales bacterium]